MYNGEKYVLGKYKTRETQRMLISVGLRVMLRQPDGTDRGYLLRAVPIDAMKKLWLFPVNYPAAEIGLIDQRGWYVIPSNSMRAENFMEFVRYYNFRDNYFGADQLLSQLKQQNSGLLNLLDSRGKDSIWYYSRLDEFEGLDILGYIPTRSLEVDTGTVPIVIVVASLQLVIALIDGAYILNINRQLRAAAGIAEKTNREKTQFLSSMSHDIRPPLNAVKYTNPGGSIRLEISEELSGDGGVTLVCVVADTGIGMSPEFQKDMYESFDRVTDSRIDKIQGSGLGLAIVRRMEDLLHLLHRCQLPLIQRAEILHKRDVILHLGHVTHAGEHHHDPRKACGKAQGVAGGTAAVETVQLAGKKRPDIRLRLEEIRRQLVGQNVALSGMAAGETCLQRCLALAL